jgi:RNAse (barnase) inhibitor barstar
LNLTGLCNLYEDDTINKEDFFSALMAVKGFEDKKLQENSFIGIFSEKFNIGNESNTHNKFLWDCLTSDELKAFPVLVVDVSDTHMQSVKNYLVNNLNWEFCRSAMKPKA